MELLDSNGLTTGLSARAAEGGAVTGGEATCLIGELTPELWVAMWMSVCELLAELLAEFGNELNEPKPDSLCAG